MPKRKHDPDGRNGERAAWGLHAVKSFQDVCPTDNCDAVADLLCDLMHLCGSMGKQYGDFESALRRGRSHYEAETSKEG